MKLLFADLEQDISRLGFKTVLWASIALLVLTVLAIIFKNKKSLKMPIFLLMTLTLIGSTAILFGSTVYLNTKSESGGPVHWHTDIQFWSCGKQLELRDPTGMLTNKIGTATFHEHNDERMHLEGVVVRKSEDASLTKFMRVTGGYLENDRIGIPLNDNKVANLKNGNTCDNESEPAEVQAFVYRYDKANKTYAQTKLDSLMDYVMRDESQVPPGDCLIVEYGAPKERTKHLCQQYGVRDSKRCVEFGVKAYSPKLCNIKEVPAGGQ